MSHFLEMDAKEIGIVFFIALMMGAPGAKLGEYIALVTNPLFSVKCCDIAYILITGVGAKVLNGPERKQYTFIFGAFWGICLGTLYVGLCGSYKPCVGDTAPMELSNAHSQTTT
jgi:hypothetical protein